MAGLQFIDDIDVWQVGFIPAAMGAGLVVYGVFRFAMLRLMQLYA